MDISKFLLIYSKVKKQLILCDSIILLINAFVLTSCCEVIFDFYFRDVT